MRNDIMPEHRLRRTRDGYKPVIEHFTPQEIGPKPWGQELLIAHTPHYTGKVLTMIKGSGGALQSHVHKDETFYLYKGHALVRYHDAEGVLKCHRMKAGESIHVPPGSVHQVEAVTKCVFFEASTPHFDDRVVVAPFE